MVAFCDFIRVTCTGDWGRPPASLDEDCRGADMSGRAETGSSCSTTWGGGWSPDSRVPAEEGSGEDTVRAPGRGTPRWVFGESNLAGWVMICWPEGD